MMRFLSLAVLAVLVWAVPAHAQSKKQMIAKDAELELRLSELESRYLTGDPAAERLLQRMDALETSQRALTGEVEQLRYERDTLRSDMKALIEDVTRLQSEVADMRARPIAVQATPQTIISPPAVQSGPFAPDPFASGSAGSFPSNPQPGTLGSATVSMSELKDIGQQKLMAGDFTGAQIAYQQYIDLNGTADDVGEAYFWLGETYFVKSGYQQAAKAYIASMEADPNGERAPNAMIGLAGALRGMGNTDGACQTLDSFPVQFPGASSDIKQKVDIERQRSGC